MNLLLLQAEDTLTAPLSPPHYTRVSSLHQCVFLTAQICLHHTSVSSSLYQCVPTPPVCPLHCTNMSSLYQCVLPTILVCPHSIGVFTVPVCLHHTSVSSSLHCPPQERKGGGLAVFVNDRWCNSGHITVKDPVCSKDIELLAISMRPYYLLREFTQVMLC